MENRMRFKTGWKQKARDSVTLRTQRLFGVIKNIYSKSNHSKSVTPFHRYEIMKTLKNYESKVEHQKTEAIELLRRRNLTL